MGTPPWSRGYYFEVEGGVPRGVVGAVVEWRAFLPPIAPAPAEESAKIAKEEKAGLVRVAIGHGEPEGPYNAGAGRMTSLDRLLC